MAATDPTTITDREAELAMALLDCALILEHAAKAVTHPGIGLTLRGDAERARKIARGE